MSHCLIRQGASIVQALTASSTSATAIAESQTLAISPAVYVSVGFYLVWLLAVAFLVRKKEATKLLLAFALTSTVAVLVYVFAVLPQSGSGATSYSYCVGTAVALHAFVVGTFFLFALVSYSTLRDSDATNRCDVVTRRTQKFFLVLLLGVAIVVVVSVFAPSENYVYHGGVDLKCIPSPSSTGLF